MTRSSKYSSHSIHGLGAIAGALLLAGCGHEASTTANETKSAIATFSASNPSQFARHDARVTWPLSELGLTPEKAKNLVARSGDALLSGQLIDSNGDATADSFSAVINLDILETRKIELLDDASLASEIEEHAPRTRAEISIKEGGQWNGKRYEGGEFVNVETVTLPAQYTDHSEWIRYEGPGIESDRVAYRIYLDWRNGFDIFGKKQPGLKLRDIGLDGYDSYHEMSDWGADILKVGDSLGMGGFGFWDGEQVIRVEQTDGRGATVNSSGQILSSLAIDYSGWALPDLKTDLDANLSMSAGSPLVHVTLYTSETLPNMAIGLGKHDAAELITGDLGDDSGWAFLATFGQQTLFDDELGKFILYRKSDARQLVEDPHNHAIVMKDTDGGLEYFFGAVWSGEAQGISDRGTFEKFLAQEIEKLAQPVVLVRNTEN
ncbi:DUF4861 family protein [Microbulbifer elongatus]|uniref:DUF4861 family protein n=1 Tax=Microbulbifer elongatus TaxID=86173 RepID=UPI001CFC8353|nr:DUF4861 family protein [Microbulbifer elongatus]